MNAFVLKGSQENPEVLLDSTVGKLEFSGKSMPENVEDIYNPIIYWLDRYIKDPQESTQVVFRFNYFNTASSKKILDVLEKISELDKIGKELKIDWHCHKEDEDMISAGESFSELIKLPFNIILY